MYLYRRILLFIAYYVAQFVHLIRQLICIEDKNATRKELCHEKRVARCYEFYHYVAVKSGAFSKYTEGRYKGHDNEYKTHYEYYNKAQNNQLNYLLDCVKINKNQHKNDKKFKLLDAGCGNGDLSYIAKYERGVETLGLTMSGHEVNVNKNRGLKAIKHSYRNLMNYFSKDTFNAIISNGSSEHLYSIEEACIDKGNSAIQQQLKQYWYVLKPGGHLCFTWIHFRDNEVDPELVAKHAWEFEVESTYWHYSVLVSFYSGWYPSGNQVIDIAKEIGFKLVNREETLNDYLQTSYVWRSKIRETMSTFRGLFWCWYIMFYELFTDPIFAYYCLAYHWGCSWTWQFEKQYDKKLNKYNPSPCTHYTMTFRKPIK